MGKFSTAEIAALSVEDRLELLEVVWDSLPKDDLPLHPEVCAELERRMATYEQDRLTARPWSEVKAQLLKPTPGGTS